MRASSFVCDDSAPTEIYTLSLPDALPISRVRDGKPVTGPTEQWTPPPKDGSGEGHTTSFSIADADGNVVCVTQSLGSVFGSGVVVPGTGVCLNNFLYWADVTPGSPNRVKHGDIMPVCVAPSIVTQND